MALQMAQVVSQFVSRILEFCPAVHTANEWKCSSDGYIQTI